MSLFKIGLATPCSTVVQIILCVSYFALLLRREKRAQQTGAEPAGAEG